VPDDRDLGMAETAAVSPSSTVRSMPPAPRVVGRFELGDRLGAGGMGVVWRARDPRLGRDVAIKVLRDAHTPERVQRLIHEARAMAQLRHDNLITIYDVEHEGDVVFIAMELVDGGSLRSWFARPGLTWRDRIGAVLAAGRGLAAAHAAGIVHRDFKPENVLVDRAGRVVVADFGLARGEPGGSARPAAEPGLTQTGSLVGTPAYMAPEQHAGEPADARSDQFALAIVAWEAIWSQRPFRGDDQASLAAAVSEGRIESPPRSPRIPAGVEAALRRALSVDRDARYASVADLLADVERALRRSAPKWPWLAVAALLVIGGVAIAVWATSRGSSKKNDAAPPKPATPSTAPTAPSEPSPAMRPLLDRMATENPWWTYNGVPALMYQVRQPDYARYLDALSPEDARWATPLHGWNRDAALAPYMSRAVTWVTYEQAERFCRAIGGKLTTSERWQIAAGAGRWGVGVAGFREWTSTLAPSGRAIVRGAFTEMQPDAIEAENPWIREHDTEASAGGRDPIERVASNEIGFRCYR
jgi:serine/threonine protein kinase